ncbi:MAG: hypothetical protein AAFP68_04155, partial [Pseudomonadota bacterium]
ITPKSQALWLKHKRALYHNITKFSSKLNTMENSVKPRKLTLAISKWAHSRPQRELAVEPSFLDRVQTV